MGNVTHLYAIYCAIKELVEIGLIKSDDGKKVKLHGVTVGNTLNNDIVIFMPDNACRTASTSTIAPELAPLTPCRFRQSVVQGARIEVSDDDLINGVSLLASYEGIFASPSGASSLADLLRLQHYKRL
ncbi:MAG: hypothetical protein WA323_02310 [Candidatus Nitrosopolaris sp.]